MSETGLFIEVVSTPEAMAFGESLQGSGGLVVDPSEIGEEAVPQPELGTLLVRDGDPERFAAWRQREELWWATGGTLDQAARLRDRWPALRWLPRIGIRRQDVVYRFNDSALGEGFRFYIPDTGAINGYLTVIDGQPMAEALGRAVALGFDALWLHGEDAEAAGAGLDLELLERAGRSYGGDIWLSGGARREAHLFNLARQGGAANVILSGRVAADCGCDRLQLALCSGGDDAVPLELRPASGQAPAPARNSRGCGA